MEIHNIQPVIANQIADKFSNVPSDAVSAMSRFLADVHFYMLLEQEEFDLGDIPIKFVACLRQCKLDAEKLKKEGKPYNDPNQMIEYTVDTVLLPNISTEFHAEIKDMMERSLCKYDRPKLPEQRITQSYVDNVMDNALSVLVQYKLLESITKDDKNQTTTITYKQVQ